MLLMGFSCTIQVPSWNVMFPWWAFPWWVLPWWVFPWWAFCDEHSNMRRKLSVVKLPSSRPTSFSPLWASHVSHSQLTFRRALWTARHTRSILFPSYSSDCCQSGATRLPSTRYLSLCLQKKQRHIFRSAFEKWLRFSSLSEMTD